MRGKDKIKTGFSKWKNKFGMGSYIKVHTVQSAKNVKLPPLYQCDAMLARVSSQPPSVPQALPLSFSRQAGLSFLHPMLFFLGI